MNHDTEQRERLKKVIHSVEYGEGDFMWCGCYEGDIEGRYDDALEECTNRVWEWNQAENKRYAREVLNSLWQKVPPVVAWDSEESLRCSWLKGLIEETSKELE